MKDLQCPTCGYTISVLDCVTEARCVGAGKPHASARMEEKAPRSFLERDEARPRFKSKRGDTPTVA